MNKGANKLYNKIKEKNLNLNYLCEVGVFKPEESNILGLINDGIKTLLVEADPIYAENLRQYFFDKGFSETGDIIKDNGVDKVQHKQLNDLLLKYLPLDISRCRKVTFMLPIN